MLCYLKDYLVTICFVYNSLVLMTKLSSRSTLNLNKIKRIKFMLHYKSIRTKSFHSIYFPCASTYTGRFTWRSKEGRYAGHHAWTRPTTCQRCWCTVHRDECQRRNQYQQGVQRSRQVNFNTSFTGLVNVFSLYSTNDLLLVKERKWHYLFSFKYIYKLDRYILMLMGGGRGRGWRPQ